MNLEEQNTKRIIALRDECKNSKPLILTLRGGSTLSSAEHDKVRLARYDKIISLRASRLSEAGRQYE